MLATRRGIARIPATRRRTRASSFVRGFVNALLCLVPIAPAWSCSIVSWPAEYPFDKTQYLFYGEVTGYVRLAEPLCGGGHCEEAWGLELKVAEAVHPAALRRQRVHLFPFAMNETCSRTATPRQRIEEVPIGAKYKVSARILDLERTTAPASGALELETFLGAPLVRLPDDADLREEAASERDYRLVRVNDDDNKFELRKDLVRLEGAASTAEVAKILSRLSYYGGIFRIEGSGEYRVDARPFVERAIADYGLPRELARPVFDDWDEAGVLYGGFADERELEHLLELAAAGRAWSQLLAADVYRGEGRYADSLFWLDLADRSGLPMAQVFSAVTYRDIADELGNKYEQPREGRATLRRSALADADRAFERAAATAKRLIAAGDEMGSVMVAALYAAGIDDSLLEPERYERYICAGRRLQPPWYRGSPDAGSAIWGIPIPSNDDRFSAYVSRETPC